MYFKCPAHFPKHALTICLCSVTRGNQVNEEDREQGLSGRKSASSEHGSEEPGASMTGA